MNVNDFSVKLQHNKVWSEAKASEYFLNAPGFRVTFRKQQTNSPL